MSRRPAGSTAWWVAATLVGALLFAVASVAAVNAWNVGAGLNSTFQTIPDALPGPGADRAPGGSSVPGRTGAPASPAGTAQNILVLGVDADPGGDSAGGSTNGASSGATARGVLALLAADALRGALVVHIPVDRKSVTVVTVPLDAGDAGASGTADTGTADTSIRAALAADGVAGAVRAAESLLAVHIDRVGAVDLAGFAAATTALGGVTVENPSTFSSGDSTFPAGPVHLAGATALDWVRGPGGSGVLRAEVQQLLLRAMLTAAVRTEALTTLRTLSDLARRLAPFIAVDEGLTSAYLAGLRLELSDIRSDVVFLTLPATDAARRDVLTATFGATR